MLWLSLLLSFLLRKADYTFVNVGVKISTFRFFNLKAIFMNVIIYKVSEIWIKEEVKLQESLLKDLWVL